MPRLPPLPDLDWSDEGAPRARAFDDVYFSRHGGLAEAEAVFLNGCGLPEAWRGRDRFAICELGFGSGLNVLATWRAWKTTREPHAQLHISTIEAFPFAAADAARALAQFPEVGDLAAKLLARWPVRARAPQRLWFPEDSFTLTLFTGDAETILPQVEGPFDAWFLDGFAPARNPAMWSARVFAEMARLSAPCARAATFTVAGEVRRGLEAAGFAVEKKPGFGAKRERLEAARTGPEAAGARTIFPYAARHPKRVAVLGAGIAGAACARALMRRGVEVVVLEAAREPGAGASGNPAGLVTPRFDRGGGALAELYLAAYLDAVAAYGALDVFMARGVEQRPMDEREAAAFADLTAEPPLPDDWLAAADGCGLWHPRAGLVDPQAAVAAMLVDAQVIYESPVRTLEAVGDSWLLRAPDASTCSPCTAWAASWDRSSSQCWEPRRLAARAWPKWGRSCLPKSRPWVSRSSGPQWARSSSSPS
jgi:tRNA 5-methylaminomethyl-2-thiouridine biosynthesis bifunctional protein